MKERFLIFDLYELLKIKTFFLMFNQTQVKDNIKSYYHIVHIVHIRTLYDFLYYDFTFHFCDMKIRLYKHGQKLVN